MSKRKFPLAEKAGLVPLKEKKNITPKSNLSTKQRTTAI